MKPLRPPILVQESHRAHPKVYNRLLRPLAAADQSQAPPALCQALTVIGHHVEDHNTTVTPRAATRGVTIV